MKRDDLIIALLLCIFAGVVFFLSDTIRTMLLVERSPIINSRFYPKLLSILLFFCGILLGIQAVIRKRMQDAGTAPSGGQRILESGGVARILITGLVSVLYLFIFLPLGFLLSTMLFMGAMIVLLGGRTWNDIALPAVLIPVAVYFLFRMLLGVPLPRGVLGFF